MAMNQIQFQAGLSMRDFQSLYGTDAQCERALFASRWPQGWRCARCGCAYSFMTRNCTGRQLWECLICGYQSSSIVGTVFEHTKLPLSVWFLALYLMTQHKNAISALALKRQLGGDVQDCLACQAQAFANHAPARGAAPPGRTRGDR